MRGKVLESAILRDICDNLAYKGLFFWRSNNIPVFGRSGDGIRRFRALPKYTPKGLPDIICLKNRHFIGLEVKREGMKQSKEQVAMQYNIEDNGGYYYVIYSVKDIDKIDLLK